MQKAKLWLARRAKRFWSWHLLRLFYLSQAIRWIRQAFFSIPGIYEGRWQLWCFSIALSDWHPADVSSHIPWPNEDRVHSRGGVPIMEKLAALLGDNHVKEVSGVCVCVCVCWWGGGRNALHWHCFYHDQSQLFFTTYRHSYTGVRIQLFKGKKLSMEEKKKEGKFFWVAMLSEFSNCSDSTGHFLKSCNWMLSLKALSHFLHSVSGQDYVCQTRMEAVLFMMRMWKIHSGMKRKTAWLHHYHGSTTIF